MSGGAFTKKKKMPKVMREIIEQLDRIEMDVAVFVTFDARETACLRKNAEFMTDYRLRREFSDVRANHMVDVVDALRLARWAKERWIV